MPEAIRLTDSDLSCYHLISLNRISQSEFPGILMEFKAASASEKEKLQILAEEALQQIEDRSYKTEMQERGINNIVCYGIAFAGKDALVKLQQL